MELEDVVVYGYTFKYNEIDRNSMAYREFINSGIIDWENLKIDFINYYLEDKFGNFYFGYHKPSDTCFLCLDGINGETDLKSIPKNMISNKKINDDFEEICNFFGKINKKANWYFLSDII